MKTNYHLIEFGYDLVQTGDLDPVYIVLYNSDLSVEELRRWLLAYWCFYDMGTASWINSSRFYWTRMEHAARSKVYPRGKERRHFRGNSAIKSIADLKQKNALTTIINVLKRSNDLE